MAYAAVVSLAQLLDQILDRHQHSFTQRQQIQSLLQKIVVLSTFLEDFPREGGKLEARITVAANQAEDIIEYHFFNENGPENRSHRGNVLNCFRQVPLSNLDSKLRKARIEIDSILKRVMQIKRSSTRENQMPMHYPTSVSSQLAINVVGFEEDLMEIKDYLCGESCNLQIIPIVGMGGIGKTTLARYALDDPLSVHRFDVRGWVTISQNYHIHSVLLRLLNSIDASNKEQYTSGDTLSLIQRVYQCLKGRRYLIVIDDIWNGNVWDDVKRVFPDDANGSRIIITSRDLRVASYVDSSIHTHEMHLMGADQSWRLLKEKVFGQEICPHQLEEIGKEIAEKCRGLPLAIVVIAGILCKVSRMQRTWESIARNVNEAVNKSAEPFAEILTLSYTSLPHPLRPCFLYMGGFPEDYEINASWLVRLWVAEGFLKSSGSKDMEEVAEDYLEDLAKRSLILINKKRYDGKIKTVKIHDVLRDLCLRKAQDEKFLHVIDNLEDSFPKCIENPRRLSIFRLHPPDIPNIDGYRIRTIRVSGEGDWDFWKSLRLVRVVDVMGVRLGSYPDEVGELLYLRHLAVNFAPHVNFHRHRVPESWSKLENLQTLVISNEEHVPTSYLPFGLWRMPQLRNVIVSDGFLPGPPAETCAPLEHLHTLKVIRRFTCSLKMLELLPNLKKLGIIYWLLDVEKTEWSKYSLNNLVHLPKLEKLNCCVDHDWSGSGLSQNIAFPVTLKKLTLSGSRIPWDDMSIIGSLPNLEVLKLKILACGGTKWETVEGQFCRLKRLSIEGTDPDHWITESSHVPRLEWLHLRYCYRLTELPYGIGEIPTLRLVEVDSCNLSLEDSAKRIEEEQNSFGNDLQVHLRNAIPRTTSA